MTTIPRVFARMVGSALPLTCLAACLSASFAANAAPDFIFHNGPIITLDARDRVAQALAVEAGRITAVGDRDTLLALADAGTRRIDLAGRSLLPGFFDSHSHANAIGLQSLSANLLPAPDGPGN